MKEKGSTEAMAKKKHSLSIWKTKWDIANVSHVEYFGYTWCEQGIVRRAKQHMPFLLCWATRISARWKNRKTEQQNGMEKQYEFRIQDMASIFLKMQVR